MTSSTLSSYARHTALQRLNALIWNQNIASPTDTHQLRLAVTLASSLDIQTLIDLAIIYAPTHPSTTRLLFTKSSVLSTIQPQPFTTLLSHSSGLYHLRKSSHCLSCLLHASPPEIIRLFCHDKPFLLALAHAYDDGLADIARSYGGVHVTDDRPVDDWETIWVQTKVSLIDAFHIILTTILQDISSASGPALASESERAFDVLFSLLDLPPSSTPAPPTPFLNRSLLADYQHTYSLSKTLAAPLHHAAEKDPRTDLLESSLRSLESDSHPGGRDPGALKLLLRPSGVPPGADHSRGTKKGKGKASMPPASDSDRDLEGKINQVLDILPHHSRTYVRALLVHPDYPFRGSAEAVIGALLEGTAPADVEGVEESGEIGGVPGENLYTMERKNVWDEDVMDLKNIRVGKKVQDASTVLNDRAFIEQMKADILRRAEEISSDEEDHATANKGPGGKGKERAVTIAFEDEEDDTLGSVKVVGDGETSSGSEAEANDEDENDVRQTPETILELAYIRDPKLFERDGATRRGKARAELRALTGWADEQIEGWRIMLERNPKKDAILQKHEFAGNRANNAQVSVGGPSSGVHGHPRGGERGRGGPRGRGGGGRGGRGGGQGGGDGGNANERAWKDKNKASRGNHNRKRGHDKKMAKAGGPS